MYVLTINYAHSPTPLPDLIGSEHLRENIIFFNMKKNIAINYT